MRAAKPAQGSVDGRVRRSEKSRETIVAALFELLGEGVLQPTAQQVALRAGVGIRSVFRHFADMESLFAALDARLEQEAEPILYEALPQGSRRVRARALVRRRARLFEHIAPYKRAGNRLRWRSNYLRARHAKLVRELRSDLLRALPELESAPREAMDALELVTSFEAWDRLRSDQRLSRERAEAALERAVLSLADTLPGARGSR